MGAPVFAFSRDITGAVPDVADQVHQSMMWMQPVKPMMNAIAGLDRDASVTGNLCGVFVPKSTHTHKKADMHGRYTIL